MRKAPSLFLLALISSLAGTASAESPLPPSPSDPPEAPAAKPAGDPAAATAGKPAGTPAAEPKLDPTQVAARRLAELVKRGSEQCAAGDVDEGLPALRAAFAQKDDADVAVSLATCEIKAQEWPSAAEHLAHALRRKEDPEQRKSLEATFLNVRARVGAVKVTVTVDGADVFAGDRFAGQSPLPGEVYVVPGKSRVFAKKTGYGEVEGKIDVKAGGTATLKLDLASGGAVAYSRVVTGSRSAAPAYVLGAFGLAALGVGAALHAAALGKGAAGDDLLRALVTDTGSANPCAGAGSAATCEALKSMRQSHDTLANVGTGLLAGGGALATAALVYGLWATFSTPPPERASALRAAGPRQARGAPPFTLDLAASPAGGGVWLRGAF